MPLPNSPTSTIARAILRRSPLTERVYAITRYKRHNEKSLVAEKKYDVTEDFETMTRNIVVEVLTDLQIYAKERESNLPSDYNRAYFAALEDVARKFGAYGDEDE